MCGMGNALPVRLSRHVMYDCLLMFTFLLVLIQVTYIMTPGHCATENSRKLESLVDTFADDKSYSVNEIGRHNTELITLKVKSDDATKIRGSGFEENYNSRRKNSLGKDENGTLLSARKFTNRIDKNDLASRRRNASRRNGGDAKEVKSATIQPGKHAVKRTHVNNKNAEKSVSIPKQILAAHDELDGRHPGQKKLHNETRSNSKVKSKGKFWPGSGAKTRMTFSNFGDGTTNKTKKSLAQCHRRILIYGGIKIIRQWTELQTFVAALQLQDDGDWSTKVSCDQCTVQLILSNRLDSLKGKDAIVFGMSPYSLKVKMSTFGHYDFDPSQLLVFYGAETPLRMRKWVPDVGNLPIDAVWSYAPTADVRIPYGYYQAGNPMDARRRNPSGRTQGKGKLIAWMGSNCVKEVFWPRMNFVRELQTHIPVDVYGKCGNLTCLPRLSPKCQNLMSQYKFYLALENAECDDYITEKFWETTLMHEVVPVVYGAPKRHYTQRAPPNSFIYAGDFKTVKQLADYLISLDKSPQKYSKYFEWRYSGSVVENFPDLKLSHFCGILPHIGGGGNSPVPAHLHRKNLAETTWFNSCRNMRKGDRAFLPTDVNATNWVPWR
ncbi:uncharacterized protein LOC119729661 [Patiria miniata]|uniref:Fucosyltransferase n=1 Tax=Patiria miniata TaxID=46514 RepID=A0A914A3K2_PATMI|nr:uncharacterized protein LOC119729661 [Patiria miniata]